MPAVSVVIPVYRAQSTVGATVVSVLVQSFSDFEIIAVDDGSPDDSAGVLRRYDDPRLTVIRQENRGLAGARNTGIRHARGEFVAFLDADDCWMPRKLERHVAHLNAEPSAGVSFSHSALMDDAGRPLGRAQRPTGGDVSLERLILNNPVSNGSTPVVRRAVLDEIAVNGQYFDESLRSAQGVEDLDCWLRIGIETDWRIVCLPEKLTWYRIHAAALSTDGRQMLRSWERVIEKARAKAPDLFARVERPARARLLRHLASRAVQAGDAHAASSLLSEALRSHAAILWEQPRPTWRTLAAVASGLALPDGIQKRLLQALR